MLWLDYYPIVAIAAAALLYVTHADDVERSLETEALRALDLDRGLDEARLQAMQAQIEPHFLFNTLANVRRLYQVDPGAARTMLRQFSLMLGRSLADIRNERSTLGREVALTLAYLGVQKIRMGDRLEFATDIPPPLRDAALPPMMLSTLVENSIKHGLAPLRGGGRVTIAADADGGTLRVRVVDTGCGLSESAGSGVGLANIQTRLAALYGAEGALSLEPNEQGGVTAILELPLRWSLLRPRCRRCRLALCRRPARIAPGPIGGVGGGMRRRTSLRRRQSCSRCVEPGRESIILAREGAGVAARRGHSADQPAHQSRFWSR